MPLSEEQKRALMVKWAHNRGMIICSREALHKLVRIINDVALGVSAFVDKNGEVHFKVSKNFNYTEMMGLKGIIEADEKYHHKAKEREPDEEESKDKSEGG